MGRSRRTISKRNTSNRSDRSVLEQLMASLRLNGGGSGLSLYGKTGDGFTNAKQRKFYNDCQSRIRSYAAIYRSRYDLEIEQDCDFTIERIHSNGDLELSVKVFEVVREDEDEGYHDIFNDDRHYDDEDDMTEEHKLFICLSDSLPRFGCTCTTSQGARECVHIREAIMYLSVDDTSLHNEFKRKIISNDIDTKALDKSLYRVNPDDIAIKQLSQLVQLKIANTRDSDRMLKPLSNTQEKSQARLAWNVSNSNRAWQITPVLQAPKKNGSGFKKGTKTSLERLALQYPELLSAQDRAVMKLANIATYYSGTYINPVEAMRVLVSADNVLFNDTPATVELGELAITLEVEPDEKLKMVLCTVTGRKIEGSFAVSGSLACSVSKDESLVTVFEISQAQLNSLVELNKLPAVSKERRDELLKMLHQVRETVPVILPESFGYKTMTDAATPVLLLRSGKSGELDYGLRIRTKGGRISLPGAAPNSWVEDTEDYKIQWVRNPRMEFSQLARMAEQLELDLNPHLDYTGSIASIDEALSLLERVETVRDQVEVLWDKESEKPIRVLGSITAKSLRVEITSKRNWFGITGSCKLGDEEVSIEKLLESMNDRDNPLMSNYVRLADGQFAKIETELRKKLERVRNVSHTDRKSLVLDSTAAHEIQALAEEDIEWKAAKAWEERMRRFQKARTLEPTLPEGLKAELRDYQIEGYKWLRRLSEWGVGGILADDMGLGKTLQTLAVLLDRAEEGPTLVIAPTSVGFNWMRETERFAPSLRPMLYRESDRKELLSDLKPGDVVISSYALALRDGSELAKVEWGTLVMDEAQAIKNGRSKTNQSISELQAKWSIALTGTPMENHLGELWSLFNVVSPGVFGGWESFRNRFATPIEKHNDPVARENLSQRLQPFILRRTKEKVLKELPSRTEVVQYVDLSPEERAQYETIRRSAIGEIQNLAALPDIKDQRFKILALLTRLRQFACHPGIVNKNWTRSSAKLDLLCSLLENLKDEGHRALVFSQFTEHLGLIRDALNERGISFQYLDGSTPAVERQRRVDAFQNGTDVAFLISLKAGGTGLNLTAADYVIHMDPWWNPAVEDQATDRAHRMGQQKPVMVYRIVARGTIEEEILALHDTKRDLVDGILEGTDASAKLSTKDLMDIIVNTNGNSKGKGS